MPAVGRLCASASIIDLTSNVLNSRVRPLQSIKISKKIQPIENTSAARPLGSKLATSGAKYFGVPRSPLSVTLELSTEKSVAVPKSVSHSPSLESKILDGFRSLCLMSD
ncbi:unnamed protein product [Alternaria alternata]